MHLSAIKSFKNQKICYVDCGAEFSVGLTVDGGTSLTRLSLVLFTSRKEAGIDVDYKAGSLLQSCFISIFSLQECSHSVLEETVSLAMGRLGTK